MIFFEGYDLHRDDVEQNLGVQVFSARRPAALQLAQEPEGAGGENLFGFSFEGGTRMDVGHVDQASETIAPNDAIRCDWLERPSEGETDVRVLVLSAVAKAIGVQPPR
ncbi:hypothetical protein [Hoeflea sp.]|uniref:hypothetical protein n=1 Tax=Hoeflea sp. TaxID=1940281 RepID=UPI003B51BBE8